MTPTLIRNDASAPDRAPGARAWEIHAGGRFHGVVAGSGRSWAAGHVGPLRSRPFIDLFHATSRVEAVAALVARWAE